MKKYLLLNLNNNYSIEDLELILDYSEVHINLLKLEIEKNFNVKDLLNDLPKKDRSKIFFYSQEMENIKIIENFGSGVHYCIVNNKIISEEFKVHIKKNLKNEFFFIMNEDILNFDKNDILNSIKEIDRSVCFSFTEILLGKKIKDYKKIKNLIFWIQKNWNNDLFFKEQSLYVQNWFDDKYVSWEDNQYYDTNEKLIKDLVMGIYGDVVVESDKNNEIKNLLNLKKNKKCIACEYFTFCRERGIGLIMDEIKINECVSVNFLKNNT